MCWAVLDALPDAVVVLNGEGRVEAFNASAERGGLELGELHLESMKARMRLSARTARHLRRGFLLVSARRRQELREWIRGDGAAAEWELLTLRPCGPPSEACVVAELRAPQPAGQLAVLLQESERRYRSLVENSGDIIFVTDLSSRMLYANPALEQQTGYTAADFQMTQRENVFIHRDDAGRVADFIATFLKGPDLCSAPIENRFVSKNGRVLWYSSVISKCLYGGEPALQFVVHNVTELRRAQEERDLRIREASEAVRARDEFLSVASHELKTPIAGLMIGLQALLRRRDRGQVLELVAVMRSVEGVERQGRKLTALINQLLDVSKIEAGKLVIEPKRVDLAALVREVCAQARRPVDVRCPAHLEAEVDPLRIEQLLSNLIENAIKFSDEDAPIEVTLETAESGAITLLVTDRGIGIPDSARELIFERFHQAPSLQSGGGMGLGLYISRQIVEMHGGTITAEPGPVCGTRMRVSLPAVH
jgi:PAS domain S-box-containing protein